MGLLAAAEKIRAEMVISAKDDASKSIKPVTGELGKAFDALSKLMDKFNDLNKVDMTQLQSSLKNIESSVSGLAGSMKSMESAKPKVLSTGAGDSHTFIGDTSGYRQKDLDANLRAQNRKLNAENRKLNKEMENYDTILDNETRTSNARYNNSIAHQKSADAYTIKANAEKEWWEYRSKHPEQFIPLMQQKRYQAGSALSGIGDQIKGLGVGGFVGGSILNTVGKGLALGPVAAFGAALTSATEGVKKFATASIEAFGQMESVKTQLSVVFGSESQSSQMFSDISQYAVKSPFGVEETSEMAILLRQSGVYASDLMDTLKMIGDTAGGNMEKMKRIANNYAQIVSIGKASMLDMRQFAYAGIPIFKEVADYLGVSQSRLRSMISDGKVTAEVIENVFKNMTGAGGIFENATEKGARTFKARQQNLKDSKQLALSSAGEMLTRWGSDKYGNDSFATSFLDFSERFYQGLQKWADFKNLTKDVQEINARQKKVLDAENKEDNAVPDDKASIIESYKADLQMYKGLLDAANKNAVSAKNGGNEERTQFWLSEASDIEKKVNRLNEILKEAGKADEEEDDKLVKYFDEAKARNEKIREARRKIGFDDELVEEGGNWEYMSTRIGLRSSGYLAGLLTENVGKFLGDDYIRNAGVIFKKEMGDALNLWATAASDFADELDEADIAIRRSRLYTVKSEREFQEQMDKNLRGKNSIESLANDIKAHNESQPSYKEKQEQEQRSLWERTIKILEEINGKTDSEGYLKLPNVKKEDFLEWFNEGGIEGEKLITTGYDGANILNRSNVKALSSNFNWAYPALESMLMGKDKNGFNLFIEKQRNDIQSGIDSYKYAILDIMNADSGSDPIVLADKFTKAYKKFNESMENWIGKTSFQETKDVLKQMQTIFKATGFKWRPVSENLEIVDDEKGKKGKDKPEYVDLWKRILESATGVKAEYIKTGTQFMDMYRPEVYRGIAQGGINGLVSNGAGFSDIGSRMVYKDKDNRQDVRQIDWEKTAQKLTKEALSMERGLEETASTLGGLSDALKSQQSVLDKLKQTMYTTGEDWSTIDQIMKDKMTGKSLSEIDRLDNAFQSISPESDEYKLGWDNKKGITILSKATGELVGSLKGVKDGSEKASDSVKKFAEEVHLDNVVQALDIVDKNLKSLANAVNAHRTVVEEANSLAKQTAQTRAASIGGSYEAMGMLRNATGLGGFSTLPNDTSGYGAGKYVSAAVSKFLGYVAGMDTKSSYAENKETLEQYGIKEDRYSSLIKGAEALQSGENDEQAVYSLMSEFKDVFLVLIDKAKEAAEADRDAEEVKAADAELNKGLYDGSISFRGRYMNSLMSSSTGLGQFVSAWDANRKRDEADAGREGPSAMTRAVFANSGQNQWMMGLYKNSVTNAFKGTPYEGVGIDEDVNKALDHGDYEEAKAIFETFSDFDGGFDSLIDGTNKWAESLGKVGDKMADVTAQGATLVGQFASSALTSSLSIMGESLAQGSDASKDLADNFRKLGAGLLSNMGTMITEAGLAMVINGGASGDKAMILAGLAMAAAGGALSFLGGYYGADDDDDDGEEDEYQRLQAIKEDLSDLLKQAREDSIYYENTVRHKNAISASEGFKTQSVNDAIITPSGNVISTAPDDYLIATKTPGALGGGGGAPQVNFSVIDKSTGIKVTQQNTRYDEDTNTFDFEAVIESKVQEIIATSKGDGAFASREARLKGRTLVM